MSQSHQIGNKQLYQWFGRAEDGVSCEDYYWRPVQGLDIPGVGAVYGLHLTVWQIRSGDLQREFDLNDMEQRIKFLSWCVVHGAKEYQAIYDLRPFWIDINRRASIVETEFSAGVSILIQLWALVNPSLCVPPTLDNAVAQKKILQSYWFGGGFAEIRQPLTLISEWQKSFLINDQNLENTRFAELLHSSRPDLQHAFDINSQDGRKNYKTWLSSHGVIETPIKHILTRPNKAWPTSRSSASGEFRKGVNLIGYAYGQLGIGEDVRMAAHALHAAGVPFTIINFDPGPAISNGDRSVEPWVTDDPIFSINLICLTALENLRLYLEKGQSLFSGRYNIGYWPWELENWPKNWLHCLSLVDEVWASSSHIKQALDRVCHLPVRLMPMAVVLDRPVIRKSNLRSKYNLPQKETLFVFSFDGGSYIERKNPKAIVSAFELAFPLGTENVALIIKCMRPQTRDPAWAGILLAARKDKRIVIISKTLSKEEVLELYAACDCYVSLHRAEGFGRGIAEALVLNLKVIATGYGGNVDFCTPTKSTLIPYNLVPILENQYVDCVDNYWAEPDITVAAAAMATVHTTGRLGDFEEFKKVGERSEILDWLFSPMSIGKRYKQVIDTILDVTR